MRLTISATTNLTVGTYAVAAALAERERAHAKHGVNSIEGSHNNSTMLAILVEEIGEVAHAMTYDQDIRNLESELVQVMAVAWAWLDQLPS